VAHDVGDGLLHDPKCRRVECRRERPRRAFHRHRDRHAGTPARRAPSSTSSSAASPGCGWRAAPSSRRRRNVPVQARQRQRLFQRFCRLTPLLRVILRDVTQRRCKPPRDHRWSECATDIAAPLAIGSADQIEPECADERALRIVARNPPQRHAHVQPIRLARGRPDCLEDR
jgi:hypothetical protein